MSHPGSDPFPQLYLRFIHATNEYPQHPGAGIAIVGATAVRSMLDGRLAPETFADTPLAGDPLKHMITATVAMHRIVGVEVSPKSLGNSLPFAYELVRNGIVSAAIEFEQDENGTRLPTIDTLSGDDRDRFVQTAHSSANFLNFGAALTALSDELLATESTTQGAGDTYRSRILGISEQYKNKPDPAARMADMDSARSWLTRELLHDLALVVPQDISMDTEEILLHNVTRHTPSPALVAKHFGAPPS